MAKQYLMVLTSDEELDIPVLTGRPEETCARLATFFRSLPAGIKKQNIGFVVQAVGPQTAQLVVLPDIGDTTTVVINGVTLPITTVSNDPGQSAQNIATAISESTDPAISNFVEVLSVEDDTITLAKSSLTKKSMTEPSESLVANLAGGNGQGNGGGQGGGNGGGNGVGNGGCNVTISVEPSITLVPGEFNNANFDESWFLFP